MDLEGQRGETVQKFREFVSTAKEVRRGRFELDASGWRRFEVAASQSALTEASYAVHGWPVDFHCHGVGRFDFTEIPELALEEVDRHLVQQGVWGILTLFLRKSCFDLFLGLM